MAFSLERRLIGTSYCEWRIQKLEQYKLFPSTLSTESGSSARFFRLYRSLEGKALFGHKYSKSGSHKFNSDGIFFKHFPGRASSLIVVGGAHKNGPDIFLMRKMMGALCYAELGTSIPMPFARGCGTQQANLAELAGLIKRCQTLFWRVWRK